jgi:hypothetical protein
MAVRYPDITDPRIPELIPNQRLIDIREQFGVPGEFLLDDYNQYYTNMNDNQPIEKIDDGVSPDFKEYIMAGGGSGGGGGVTPELLGSQDGAIGYVRPLDSKDGITSLQNSMTGSFDITPVTKEEFEKNRALNSRFIDYNDYFQKTVADGQFSFPKEKTGILQNIKDGGSKFLDFIKKGGVIGNMVSEFLPEQDPRSIFMRNYYGGKDSSNLTSSGSIASGLMKGYNPVSGGGLYTLTGGRLGEEPTYGLQNAYEKRINNIRDMLTDKYSGISADMTDEELEKYMSTPEGIKALKLNIPNHSAAIENYFKLKEERQAEAEALRGAELRTIQQRVNRGESLSSIGKDMYTGPGKAFAPRQDTFTKGKTVTLSDGRQYSSPK